MLCDMPVGNKSVIVIVPLLILISLFNVARSRLNICLNGTEKETLSILPFGIITLCATIVPDPSKLTLTLPLIWAVIPVFAVSFSCNTGRILFRFSNGGIHINPMMPKPINTIIVQNRRRLCRGLIFILSFPCILIIVYYIYVCE